MSIKHMSSVWEHSQHSGSKLLLLLALADHANDQGICWPSIATLAQKARISERQTQRLIQELENSGEIAIIEHGNGRGHSTVYMLKGDITVSSFKPAKGDITVSSFKEALINGKGDIQRVKGDIQRVKGDIAMSPEPPIEPPIEPPLLQMGGGSGLDRNRKTDPEYAEVCTAYESNGFGMLTPFSADEIKAMLDEYPKDWILDAMKISVTQNKRKLSYTVGILKRWRANGRDKVQAKTQEQSPSWQKFNQDLPEYMREMMQ